MIPGLSDTGWLTVGEGALAFVLGLVIGALWVVVRILSPRRPPEPETRRPAPGPYPPDSPRESPPIQ